MKKFFKSQHWVKMLTRDIPFIRLIMIYESYAERAKKDIGLNYPSGFSFLRGGIFYIYRSKEGITKYNNNFLKVRNKKQFFENILKKTKLVKKKTLKDIKFCENKLKSGKKATYQDLLEIFKILYQTFKNFWNLQYFPLGLEFSLNNFGRDDLILKYKKYLVVIRAETQNVTVKLEDLVDSTLEKINKKKGLPENLIFFATPSEVINNRLVKKNLIKRKKISLLGFKGNKAFIYSGKKAKNLVKDIISAEKSLTTKEIKGNPAYLGKVKGVVKVILFRKDLKNVKKGQILVASMTEVYYTPYLKQVKAIITDEGGITCHAAIVSRELKKPCIIGTKIATRVFKDGDLVEVDANKGVVKILKRK